MHIFYRTETSAIYIIPKYLHNHEMYTVSPPLLSTAFFVDGSAL